MNNSHERNLSSFIFFFTSFSQELCKYTHPKNCLSQKKKKKRQKKKKKLKNRGVWTIHMSENYPVLYSFSHFPHKDCVGTHTPKTIQVSLQLHSHQNICLFKEIKYLQVKHHEACISTPLSLMHNPGFWHGTKNCLIDWVEVLRPSQPIRVMSSMVGLLNHTFTGKA